MNMFKKTEHTTPQAYINSLDEPRGSQIAQLHALIRKYAPSLTPYMYGNIIGYGKEPYKTKSGLEGDWFILGLASQKSYISVYSCTTKDGHYLAESYKNQLPNANIGKSCIRFKKIEDIDLTVLEKLIKEAYALYASKG